jgi:hypothetical protein
MGFGCFMTLKSTFLPKTNSHGFTQPRSKKLQTLNIHQIITSTGLI